MFGLAVFIPLIVGAACGKLNSSAFTCLLLELYVHLIAMLHQQSVLTQCEALAMQIIVMLNNSQDCAAITMLITVQVFGGFFF